MTTVKTPVHVVSSPRPVVAPMYKPESVPTEAPALPVKEPVKVGGGSSNGN